MKEGLLFCVCVTKILEDTLKGELFISAQDSIELICGQMKPCTWVKHHSRKSLCHLEAVGLRDDLEEEEGQAERDQSMTEPQGQPQ